MAILDTGSPFLIISNPNSDYCATGACSSFASYDPTLSTSAVWVSDDMYVVYELTSDSGSWYYDSLSIGDAFTVDSFPIGTANGSSTKDIQNWFGIGAAGGAGPEPASNSLQLLAQAGAIASASMGMYLGALDASNGEVTFGGLDTSKWQGDLAALPIVTADQAGTKVTLSSVGLSGQDVASDNLPATVLVDTGNFDIKLPQDVVDGIWSQIGGIQSIDINVGSSSLPYGSCDCSMGQNSDTITFGFDGVSIDVPMSDLVVPPSQFVLAEAGNPDIPDGTCLFMINSWGPNPPEYSAFILGDAFLRNAYYVLAWDSNEIALGQGNHDGGDSNTIAIAPGETGLQDAIASAAGGSTSTGAPSGTAAGPTSDGPSATASSSPSPTESPSSNLAPGVSSNGLIVFGVALIAAWSSLI